MSDILPKEIYLGMVYRGMMTGDDGTGQAVSDDEHEGPKGDEGFETIEAYDVDDGVVLYDAENPLAWVRTDYAVELHDLA